MKSTLKFLAFASISLSLLLGGTRPPQARPQQQEPTQPQPQQTGRTQRLPYPELSEEREPRQVMGRRRVGGAAIAGSILGSIIGSLGEVRNRRQNLSPELGILIEQFRPRREGEEDAGAFAYSAELLERVFDIAADERNPRVEVAITVAPNYDVQTILDRGGEIHYRLAGVIYAKLPLLSLPGIAENPGVQMVSAMAAPRVPPAPKNRERAGAQAPALPAPEDAAPAAPPTAARPDSEFDKGGLSGRGVIVGVVDTGIDWRHPDFIKEDGTSRILYLWDMFDRSHHTSGGRIGSAPPALAAGGAPGPGTVYTKEQLDAALAGQGTVNSKDEHGHGTAVAGTAAGNGRASGNGVAAGTYAGVAPEADLIVVKGADCGSFRIDSYLGTVWIAQTAQALGRPFVANHSYGGHYTAHDGTDEEERIMNSLIGRSRPGAAITVAAGNEGELNFHASGRFGPRRRGQRDFEGTVLVVTVLPTENNKSRQLDAYFNRGDDWGLVVYGSGTFLVDGNTGEQQFLYVYKHAGQVEAQIRQGVNRDVRNDLTQYAKSLLRFAWLAPASGGKDQVTLMLPPGTYEVQGYGATANVPSGRFDMYLPDGDATFASGGDKKYQIGSPGNASDVITVGAYDFRDSWQNSLGDDTLFSLDLGGISTYSSQGGRFGTEVYKPELAAPATFTISPLSGWAGPSSTGCDRKNMGRSASFITRDGFHLAWEGTSASAPFTAGVVALMLEKNPTLDSTEIKRILTQTASRDGLVGAVPNAEWGYGRLNPAAALAATPPAPRNDQR